VTQCHPHCLNQAANCVAKCLGVVAFKFDELWCYLSRPVTRKDSPWFHVYYSEVGPVGFAPTKTHMLEGDPMSYVPPRASPLVGRYLLSVVLRLSKLLAEVKGRLLFSRQSVDQPVHRGGLIPVPLQLGSATLQLVTQVKTQGLASLNASSSSP
jgi:hypothetical protein